MSANPVSIEELAMLLGQKDIEIFLLHKKIDVLTEALKAATHGHVNKSSDSMREANG